MKIAPPQYFGFFVIQKEYLLRVFVAGFCHSERISILCGCPNGFYHSILNPYNIIQNRDSF